uniref:Uncharacterized protein n=1 Tax=Kalanchoe fedtschenkoi TaxID=63787 RepID=A0A7N0SVB8_KALFE
MNKFQLAQVQPLQLQSKSPNGVSSMPFKNGGGLVSDSACLLRKFLVFVHCQFCVKLESVSAVSPEIFESVFETFTKKVHS